MLQHFCINPNTNRRIKVGGAMYKKLIKQGMLETSEHDDNVVADYNSQDEPEYTQEMIDEYNKELPVNQHVVRGRGAYKNKLVKRAKVPSYEEVVEHTAKVSKKALKKVRSEDMDETELEQLIMEELLKLQPKQNSRTKKPLKGKASKFAVKESSSDESDDSDESD